MLDARDTFKLAFLARCVEEGLSPDETLARVKLAREKVAITDLPGKLLDTAKTVGTWGAIGALTVPPALGYYAGGQLSHLTDTDETDVAEVQQQEVIDAYLQQAELSRQKRLLKMHQRQARPGGRIYA